MSSNSEKPKKYDFEDIESKFNSHACSTMTEQEKWDYIAILYNRSPAAVRRWFYREKKKRDENGITVKAVIPIKESKEPIIEEIKVPLPEKPTKPEGVRLSSEIPISTPEEIELPEVSIVPSVIYEELLNESTDTITLTLKKNSDFYRSIYYLFTGKTTRGKIKDIKAELIKLLSEE